MFYANTHRLFFFRRAWPQMRASFHSTRPRLASPPSPTRPLRRQTGVAAASGDGNRGGAAPVDSDAAYVAKVAAASVVGEWELFL